MSSSFEFVVMLIFAPMLDSCVDASGLSFDAQALRRDDALAGALLAVEDRSAAV